MQWLVIGGLVLVLAGALLIGLLTWLAQAADASSKEVGRWRLKVARRISRADLELKAAIPKLIESFSEKSLTDRERIALTKYDPVPYPAIRLKTHKYKEQFSTLFSEPDTAANVVDIAQIPRLLSFNDGLSFQKILDMERRPSPDFPDPKLQGIEEIESPPEWKAWITDKVALEFSVPLYAGWKSIFNRYVYAAYAKEVDRVNQAKLSQQRVEVCFKERNEAMQKLQKHAVEKYEATIALSKKNWASVRAQDKVRRDQFESQFQQEQSQVGSEIARINGVEADGLVARVEWMLRTLSLPNFVSREGMCRYDEDSRILIFEHRLPDLAALEFVKAVELKAGWTRKPANQKEARDNALRIYPSLSIRFAAELVKLDWYGQLTAIVVNGWADYVDQSTGQTKRAYCSSMFATVEQIEALNLSALDPVVAFSALKGIAARSLEVTPIAPIFRIDTNDKRFVDAKEVIGKLNDGENLAAMDWEDFEHLCRELFERAFAGSGAEVKVTQASRDQGVDAVIFNPDPVRGGKIVVQAKRYTNTVDVSAVRDLYGSTMNEGAMKGILVTTSSYGPDAYAFAKDKPITLLNGAELLGLLEKYGYKFRIDLAEAKKLNEVQRY